MSVPQFAGTGNGLQNFRIFPQNAPADNVFGHQANPIISFELPSSNVLLKMKDLRVTGKMRVKAGTFGGSIANTQINQYLGVNSAFQTMTLSSRNSRAVIERIVNYPILVNSILPAIKDSASFRNELGEEMLSTQSNNFMKNYIMTQMSQDAEGVEFSTPVFMGVTMASGDSVPLQQIGGVVLTIELAPDSAVFTTSDAIQPQYELFDLALVGCYYVGDDEERSLTANMSDGVLEVNTFSSLFSTVQSTQQTATYSLGLSDVIAVLFSFCPAVFINNYQFDQNARLRLSEMTTTSSNQLVKVNALRNGVQVPFNYDLSVVPESLEAELHRYYLMSLSKISELTTSSVDSTTNDIRYALGSTGNLVTTTNLLKDINKANVCYGIPYDILGYNSGISFDSSPLTLELTSTLKDGTSNAQNVYVLSKVKIMYGKDGIRVMN